MVNIEYKQKVEQFKEHLRTTVNEIIELANNGEEISEKYDFTITVNGKQIVLGASDETYDSVIEMLDSILKSIEEK